MPDGQEAAALAALDADPDVRYAAPDVDAAHRRRRLPGIRSSRAQRALRERPDPDIDAVRAWETSGRRRHGRGRRPGRRPAHPDLWATSRRAAPGLHAARRLHGRRPTGLADHGTTSPASSAPGATTASAIAGVAPEAHVLPVRAFDNCGGGQMSGRAGARLRRAAGRGDVVGRRSAPSRGQIDAAKAADYNQAFAELFRAYPDTLFVVAAGNEGNDNDVLPVYPCSTVDPAITTGDIPNLVCVGMARRRGRPATARATSAGIGRHLRPRHVDLVDVARPDQRCSGHGRHVDGGGDRRRRRGARGEPRSRRGPGAVKETLMRASATRRLRDWSRISVSGGRDERRSRGRTRAAPRSAARNGPWDRSRAIPITTA